MLIYILEDDENIREIESYALQSNGFQTQSFANPSDFYNALEKEIPGLIILDVMLPEEDGLSVLQKLKAQPMYANIPIIIISAKTEEIDRVKGIDLGADDYMCKPFGVMELLSRVKARLRNVTESAEYSYEGIVLSESQRTVWVDNQKIELTYKEFELLKLFMKKPGIVRSREMIMQSVWGYEDNLGRTLDMHINTLRKKLGKKSCYIVTVRNIGYKFEKGAAEE